MSGGVHFPQSSGTPRDFSTLPCGGSELAWACIYSTCLHSSGPSLENSSHFTSYLSDVNNILNTTIPGFRLPRFNTASPYPTDLDNSTIVRRHPTHHQIDRKSNLPPSHHSLLIQLKQPCTRRRFPHQKPRLLSFDTHSLHLATKDGPHRVSESPAVFLVSVVTLDPLCRGVSPLTPSALLEDLVELYG